jgi:hypothetical protein
MSEVFHPAQISQLRMTNNPKYMGLNPAQAVACTIKIF